jgi:YVTN family beta-propeller protein
MAYMTGGTAVAERPSALWLATLPTAVSDTLPAVRPAAQLQRAVRPAGGMLSGLPGAVTDLSVSEDGRHLVAAHYGDDALSVIDVATLTVLSTVSDIAEPYAVTTADRAYVRSASIAEDSVVAVDLESGSQLATREVGTGARGLVAGPGGERLYVARATDGQAEVAVIKVESGVITVIPVATAPGASIDAVRINAAGTRLYVALTTATGGALVMIDVRSERVQTVPVGASIGDIAVDSSERRVFVTGTDADGGAVLRIVDTATARLVHTLPMGGLPVALLVTGGTLYVADGETVVAIDVATARVVNRKAFGRPVSCLAVSQDGTRLYVGDFDGNVEAMAVDAASAGLRSAS